MKYYRSPLTNNECVMPLLSWATPFLDFFRKSATIDHFSVAKSIPQKVKEGCPQCTVFFTGRAGSDRSERTRESRHLSTRPGLTREDQTRPKPSRPSLSSLRMFIIRNSPRFIVADTIQRSRYLPPCILADNVYR